MSREVDCSGAGVVAELAGMILRGEFLLALFQVNYSVMLPQNGWIFACKATFLARKYLHLDKQVMFKDTLLFSRLSNFVVVIMVE